MREGEGRGGLRRRTRKGRRRKGRLTDRINEGRKKERHVEGRGGKNEHGKVERDRKTKVEKYLVMNRMAVEVNKKIEKWRENREGVKGTYENGKVENDGKG